MSFRQEDVLIKRAISTILVIVIFSTPTFAKYSGGSGDPNTPYQIATAADLNDIGNHPEDFNKCFVMTTDIDLSEYKQFKVVGFNAGYYEVNAVPFTGVFDGEEHSIISMRYDACSLPTTYPLDRGGTGIFGLVDGNNAKIKNVSIIDPCVAGRGNWYVGALVGHVKKGIIENCHVSGGYISGFGYVGGLIGRHEGSVINSSCSSLVESTGNYTGGLVGGNFRGIVSGCYAAGTVTSQDDMVGGLVGFLHYGSLTRCFSTADVNGDDSVGGLVGEVYSASIVDCYVVGFISGDSRIGGLIGYNRYNEVTRCYSACDVNGTSGVGGFIGENFGSSSISNGYFLNTAGPNNGYGTPLTDSQMKQQASFTGWDFVWEIANGTNDVWAICEGVSYPKLAWQFIVGDSDNDKDVDFSDFAALANKWMQADSSLYCGGTDLTGDSLVNWNDLSSFAENWLSGL